MLIRRRAAALAFCMLLTKAAVAALTPPPGSGRITGRVIDRAGSAMPAATVVLTGDAVVTRSSTTDSEGRFVFDSLGPGDSYIVRAELTGFEAAPQTGVVVRSGETTQVEITLKVGCLESPIVHHGVSPAFDVLLQADAIFHVRVAENGHNRKLETDDSCEIVTEAPVTVLRIVSLAAVPLSPVTIARALSDDALAAGSEYVVFHRRGRPADELFINQGLSFPVEGGRVMGVFEDRLGIANGVAVDQAIAGLQQTYKRHTLYRNYDDLTSAAAFETLRYKTGWIEMGVLDPPLRKWTDEQPFEFEAAPKISRTVPRPGDRILLKERQSIYILDFGSRGEARRKRSPTTRPDGVDLADNTGTRASPHMPYTVADVQCERGYENQCLVWMRLIAK